MKPQKPTVLVAEDDSGARKALATRLSQADFDVVGAADGAAAIALLKSRRIDAAVLDVDMPATDGFGVCEFIRGDERCKQIPVVFLTGASTGLLRNHLGSLSDCVGGNLYLTKPYDGKLLAVMLRDALHASARNASPPAAATQINAT